VDQKPHPFSLQQLAYAYTNRVRWPIYMSFSCKFVIAMKKVVFSRFCRCML